MVNNMARAIGLEGLTTPARNANRSNDVNGRTFDSFLSSPQHENAERQQERPVKVEGQRDNRPVMQSVETTQRQTVQPVSDDEMATATVEDIVVDATDTIQSIADEATVLSQLEEDVIVEIAAILGITPQMLIEVLNTLGMTVLDLQDGEGQAELLQLLHGLDDGVALLSLPSTLPIMQEITKAMEKHAPVMLEYQAKQEMQNQPQYVVLEETALADFDTLPDAEIMHTVRDVRADAPEPQEADMLAEFEAMDIAQAMTQGAAETIATTDNAQPSLEPIMAFAQAAELPIDSFARAETTAQPLPQAPINPQNVMEQIVSHMKFEVRGDMAEIRIQLKPDNLGEVALRIATHNGIVVAQFVAESQRVKEIIEAGFSQLRDTLEQQGINIAEIEVSVSQDKADSQFEFGSNVSSSRIQNLMEFSAEDDAEEANLEENLVDYRV
ncbi:MAG: flagellar hook-length control protein FliK [Defluviitaleaceae bacterium]|nr:flagellar hook-length control protein FliK [Defluviitaleaceae bacterium]